MDLYSTTAVTQQTWLDNFRIATASFTKSSLLLSWNHVANNPIIVAKRHNLVLQPRTMSGCGKSKFVRYDLNKRRQLQMICCFRNNFDIQKVFLVARSPLSCRNHNCDGWLNVDMYMEKKLQNAIST